VPERISDTSKTINEITMTATILVDQDLCTRCGICSVVCPMKIIGTTDENTLPKVADEKSAM
jgi:Fe-S-cluster-containing hydrogenase component 2